MTGCPSKHPTSPHVAPCPGASGAELRLGGGAVSCWDREVRSWGSVSTVPDQRDGQVGSRWDAAGEGQGTRAAP